MTQAEKLPLRRRDRRAVAKKPLRTAGTSVLVAALAATAVIPAIGAFASGSESVAQTRTVQQEAEGDSQSFVAASELKEEAISRDSYTATTSEELEKKRAEEVAVARVKEAAAAATAGTATSTDVALVAPGTGAVRWPVTDISSIGWLYGTVNNGSPHDGVDMLADSGTPIYAATSGVVTASAEVLWGYGVAIEIEGTVGGKKVLTTYAHMVNGTRQVRVGDTVTAGQFIGRVGSTGNSSVNHLHFETQINGSLVDPLQWLEANAD